MIELSETNIEYLLKKYGSQLTYLYCDFVGGLNAIEKLYNEPQFNYHEIGDFQEFEKAIFKNLWLITQAIDKNLPNLSRIRAEQPTINIAFCRNLWVHELLLHESWKDSEQKADYLNYAFEEIFRDFDTKAVSNFDTEFLPYDMPWASIAYHFIPSEERLKYEREVYENFYKTHFLNKNNFHAPTPKTLRFNDSLNFALRISNKLKDYKKLRVIYFDVKRFPLYEELSKLIKKENYSSDIKNMLSSFLCHEFKNSITWNSIFFLSAPKFREIIDLSRGRITIEKQVKLIQQVEKNHSTQSRKTSWKKLFSYFRTIFSLTKYEKSYESFDTGNIRRYVDRNLTTFIRKLMKGLRIHRPLLLLDNNQILDKQEKRIFSKIKRPLSKNNVKAINREEGKNPVGSIPIEQIGPETYELVVPPEGNVSKIIPYLACLNGFDKSLASLLAKHLDIEWTSEDWKLLRNQEWVQSRSQNWFYINQSQAVIDIIKPEYNLWEKYGKFILNHLRTYQSPLDSEIKMAHMDWLVYGLRLVPKTTMDRVKRWLSGLKESDLRLTKQLILLGRQYNNQIDKSKKEISFDNLPTSIENINQQKKITKWVAPIPYKRS